jgi:hypothetical protein
VRSLSVMAGTFGEASFLGKERREGVPEFNLLADVASARALFENWPTPIVATGVEIGLALLYPPESIAHDFGYVRHHPIAETYLWYCEEQRATYKWSCPHAHATSDLISVLYAARPDRNYFALSKPGRFIVFPDGSSRCEQVPEGRFRYLMLNEEQKARVLEAVVMLTSQPPAHRAEH